MSDGAILFPETGFTREDAVAYYQSVGRILLPHTRNRPLSFRRYPSTIHGESFWEKDAPSFTPKWVTRVRVPRRTGETDIEYIVANNVRTLTWIASVGGVELHPFLHRHTDLNRPIEVVFDLDPGTGATIVECCEVAIILRDALHAMNLESLVKVSGSKGLQVYVPLNTRATHEQTETFARLLAEALARKHPSLIVAKMTKSIRANKVFIDWSQNADYKTTVGVYSLRSKSDEPMVSMPMKWSEIAKPKKLHFTPDEALRRVKKIGDLWAPVLKMKQKLPPIATAATRAREKRTEAATTGLPKPGSQSGRRLFILAKTENGNELWLDMHGKFKRWILRPDREGGGKLIAMPAGDFKINPEYYRGDVPKEWSSRVKIEDSGAYEVVEGSYQQRRFALFFSGDILAGEWLLEKISAELAHRSWRLELQAVRQ